MTSICPPARLQLRYPIRALAGTNEETHMQDVDYYLKNYPAPAFCFTPDAEFNSLFIRLSVLRLHLLSIDVT